MLCTWGDEFCICENAVYSFSCTKVKPNSRNNLPIFGSLLNHFRKESCLDVVCGSSILFLLDSSLEVGFYFRKRLKDKVIPLAAERLAGNVALLRNSFADSAFED
jgi:hypothetical protein